MYILVSGEVAYRREGLALSPPLQKMEWISEPPLWLPWRHPGELVAVSEAEFITMSAKGFSEAICANLEAWVVASKYAEQFLALVLRLGKTNLSDVLRQGEFYDTVVRDIT